MELREQILSANDYELEKVEVPEWGVDVYLKPLSLIARNRLYAEALGDDKKPDLHIKVLIECICDQNGKKQFTLDDIEALDEKNPDVLIKLEALATKISGLNPEAVEQAEKN